MDSTFSLSQAPWQNLWSAEDPSSLTFTMETVLWGVSWHPLDDRCDWACWTLGKVSTSTTLWSFSSGTTSQAWQCLQRLYMGRDVYHAKGQSKKELTRCRRTLELWNCAWAWEQWCCRQPLRARLRLVIVMIRTSARLRQHKQHSQDLRERLQQDRADYVEALLQPLQASPGKSAVKLLRPLRLGKRHRTLGLKALPIVRDEQGQVVGSRIEALERWRRHFGHMEGGQSTTTAELWQSHQRQLEQRPPIHLTTSDLPTLQELEMQLRKAPMGKACGLDGIPGELLHSACPYLAPVLWPLLLKMTSRIQEPMQWKGGQLVALHKGKSSPMECSSYRAILVSSALGKSMHGVFRARTMPFLQREATHLQFSVHPHAMVSMAAHCIRLAQGKAKRSSTSDYTIFVDIASAYYTLLRQHCVDLSWYDEDIICLLRRLGIENTHIESVAAMLSATPAFGQLGVPEPLHALVAEFSLRHLVYAGSWLAVNIDPSWHQARRWLRRRTMERCIFTILAQRRSQDPCRQLHLSLAMEWRERIVHRGRHHGSPWGLRYLGRWHRLLWANHHSWWSGPRLADHIEHSFLLFDCSRTISQHGTRQNGGDRHATGSSQDRRSSVYPPCIRQQYSYPWPGRPWDFSTCGGSLSTSWGSDLSLRPDEGWTTHCIAIGQGSLHKGLQQQEGQPIHPLSHFSRYYMASPYVQRWHLVTSHRYREQSMAQRSHETLPPDLEEALPLSGALPLFWHGGFAADRPPAPYFGFEALSTPVFWSDFGSWQSEFLGVGCGRANVATAGLGRLRLVVRADSGYDAFTSTSWRSGSVAPGDPHQISKVERSTQTGGEARTFTDAPSTWCGPLPPTHSPADARHGAAGIAGPDCWSGPWPRTRFSVSAMPENLCQQMCMG